MKAKKFNDFVNEDSSVNEKVKLIMKNILSKMVPAAFGASTNPKMRQEIKDAVEAAIKPILKKYDYVVEAEDHEVGMAQNQLEAIIDAAMDLQEKIGNEEIDLPAWIQSHITSSYEYIKQANDGYHELKEGKEEMFLTYNEIIGYEFDKFIESYRKLHKDNDIVRDKKNGVTYGFRKGSKIAHWKYFEDSGQLHHSEKDREVLGLIHGFRFNSKNHPWSK